MPIFINHQMNYLANIVSSRNAISISKYGDTTISTSIKKFGVSSGYFDGNGDYLLASSNTFGTTITSNNFTIESWFYLPSDGTADYPITLRSSGGNQIGIRIRSTGLIDYRQNTTNAIVSSGLFSFDTWNHVALVRNSGTTSLYLNGSSQGSVSDSLNISGYDNLYIGYDPGLSGYVNGYIDEFRFSKSARYTGNFTTQSSEFANDTNTVFLCHFNEIPFIDSIT